MDAHIPTNGIKMGKKHLYPAQQIYFFILKDKCTIGP
jgi:hypothetical protein